MAEPPCFYRSTEAGLRQWVEANPGRVNDSDSQGRTPLLIAVASLQSLPLVFWLLDEKGADRGADPTLRDCKGETPLITQAYYERAGKVAHLLQDPRVRATIDVQDRDGRTALYQACCLRDETVAISIVHPSPPPSGRQPDPNQ